MNKVKMVLVNASDYLIEDSLTGLGIGYIKSYLLKNNKKVNVKIFRKDIIQNIIQEKPDILGINSISYYYPDALKIARKIKQIFGKKIKIIIGGVHITVLPQSFDPIFDFGIIGEGEQTMLELTSLISNELTCIKKRSSEVELKKIKGICFIDKNDKLIITQKRDSIINLDTIPHIDRKDFSDNNIILTSRGCPYNCMYCASREFWGNKKVRFFSVDYLLEEIKNLNEIGIHHIAIWDDMCILDKNRIKELSSRIYNEKSINKNTTLEISFNSSIYSEDIIKYLKKLKVTKVNMSFDSGSNFILEKIGRGTTCETNKKMYKQLVSNNIQVNVNFTVNNYKETEFDLFETIQFIKNNEITNAKVFVNNPLPGSNVWFLYLKKKRLNIKNVNYDIFKNKKVEDISEFNTANISSLSLKDLKKWSYLIQDEILNIQRRKIFFTRVFFLALKKSINKLNFFYKKIFFWNISKNAFIFPKIITIKMTNKCNLNCFMCVNSRYRNSHINELDFTIENAKKCLPDMIKYKPLVILSGGEPLLCDDIFDIAKLFTGYKIPVQLLTNGYITKKYIKDIYNSDINSVSFSLDHYIAEKHNRIRGSLNSFNNLIKSLKELGNAKMQYNLNLKIIVATVITKYNFDKLVEIYDFVEKLGFVSEWSLRHLSFINKDIYEKQVAQKKNKAYPIDFVQGMLINNYEYFNKDDISILKEQLLLINNKSKFAKTKLVIEKSILKKLYNYYLGKNISKYTQCNGIDNMKISNRKILTFCEYEIGNLNKDSIFKAWNSRSNNFFQNNFIHNNTLPQCFRCPRLKLR